MENTIQKKSHEVQIYGHLYKVETGTRIWPDNWAGPTNLEGSDWDRAEFYLPSYQYRDTGVVAAVNIRVTGRTLQRRSFSSRLLIRVQIEFVGDGGESTFSKGWMLRKEAGDVA